MRHFLTTLVFVSLLFFAACSKLGGQSADINGEFVMEYKYPEISLDIKKGECVRLSIETQTGLSFETTDVSSAGKYPNIKYTAKSNSRENELAEGMCTIDATFISSEEFQAEVHYYISEAHTEDVIGANGEAGDIPTIRFLKK